MKRYIQFDLEFSLGICMQCQSGVPKGYVMRHFCSHHKDTWKVHQKESTVSFRCRCARRSTCNIQRRFGNPSADWKSRMDGHVGKRDAVCMGSQRSTSANTVIPCMVRSSLRLKNGSSVKYRLCSGILIFSNSSPSIFLPSLPTCHTHCDNALSLSPSLPLAHTLPSPMLIHTD